MREILINSKILLDKLDDLIKDEYDERDESYNLGINHCVDEIIKSVPIDNDWIPCELRLPDTTIKYINNEYLVCTKSGKINILSYCDGWNCSYNEDRTIYRKSEIFDIIAWKELPERYIKAE